MFKFWNILFHFFQGWISVVRGKALAKLFLTLNVIKIDIIFFFLFSIFFFFFFFFWGGGQISVGGGEGQVRIRIKSQKFEIYFMCNPMEPFISDVRPYHFVTDYIVGSGVRPPPFLFYPHPFYKGTLDTENFGTPPFLQFICFLHPLLVPW